MTDEFDPSFSSTTHPFAVRVDLSLVRNQELEFDQSEKHSDFIHDRTLIIQKIHGNQEIDGQSTQRLDIKLGAFTSSSDAQQAGKLLVRSLLWAAVSKKSIMTLHRRNGGAPYSVYNRNSDHEATVESTSVLFSGMTLERLLSLSQEAYIQHPDTPDQLLVSMEFYASARVERTEHARFIGYMTALESLSVQIKYNEDIGALLEDLAQQIKDSSTLEGEENHALRSSLADSVKLLQRESVRRAMKRTVLEHLGDKATEKFVDEAYGVRSKMLHDGKIASNLNLYTSKLEPVLRRLYAAMLGLELQQP